MGRSPMPFFTQKVKNTLINEQDHNQMQLGKPSKMCINKEIVLKDGRGQFEILLIF